MNFMNIKKIAERYGVSYINTAYGSYGASQNTRKLSKKGIWVAVNGNGELKCGREMLNNGNLFLDTLANELANGKVTVTELQ